MRYNKDILRLKKEKHYPEVKKLLNSILRLKIPDESLIRKLYGNSRLKIVLKDIEIFLASFNPGNKTPRLHLEDSPEEISKQRSIIERNQAYQVIQSPLLFNKLPGLSDMQNFYGEYAESVREVFSKYLELNLKRKCGISATCHLNRVGAVVHGLKMDENNLHLYQAIGAMHDTIEDLFFLVKNKNNNKLSFNDYDDFINKYVPFEIAESIKLLTNHFDLILALAVKQLRSSDKYLTKSNLINQLQEMTDTKCESITKYINSAYKLLSDAELEPYVLESAKWLCYKNLYIVEMARLSHEKNNYRPFEIKAVDLSDNGHGKDALPIASRIKNLIKQGIWAREGYGLNSTWEPLNNRIMEIQEDALVHAEHLIIRDFLEPQSSQDFIVSALLKIEELKSIFFE